MNIRADRKSLLSHLDEEWIRCANASLCKHLKELLCAPPLAECSKILAWMPFFPGEIDVLPLIGAISQGQVFYLPRAHPDSSMTFISLGDDWRRTLGPGLFGIPEPEIESGNQFVPEADGGDTVVLVPGLVFDRSGNRIGRGGGYYDRFLGLSGMEKAKKVGIAWSQQIETSLSPAAHDVPVDFLCTEEGAEPIKVRDEESI